MGLTQMSKCGVSLLPTLHSQGCQKVAALRDATPWFLQGMARPSGRRGHSMALTHLPDNKAGLIVFGGASKNEYLHSDTGLLELPSLL